MIEKIIIPTLDRTAYRRYINLGALVTMGVPHHLIEYFPARDCEHYVGDAARAVEDAKKEGWKMNPRKAETYSRWLEVDRLKWFCMRWTFTMIFQKIMKAPPNQYYMFLIDDFGLKRPYDELLQVVRFAVRDSEKLVANALIIQLDAWGAIDCPRVEREPICSATGAVRGVLARGLGGAGDGGLIVNNKGAHLLYERMCKTGGAGNLEGQLWQMAQEPNQSGFYSIVQTHYMIGNI